MPSLVEIEEHGVSLKPPKHIYVFCWEKFGGFRNHPGMVLQPTGGVVFKPPPKNPSQTAHKNSPSHYFQFSSQLWLHHHPSLRIFLRNLQKQTAVSSPSTPQSRHFPSKPTLFKLLTSLMGFHCCNQQLKWWSERRGRVLSQKKDEEKRKPKKAMKGGRERIGVEWRLLRSDGRRRLSWTGTQHMRFSYHYFLS